MRPARTARMIPVLIVVCLVILPAQAQYSGGTGEPNDPYQIATAADLILLGETPDDYDKHFILTADIDLSGFEHSTALIASDANATRWEYDGTPFTGVFDGNEHTISHLTITGGSYLGLFGEIGAMGWVRSLRVTNANINGTGGCIGTLAGSNRGIVTDCLSDGRISGDDVVGGLIGSNRGIVNSSLSSGAVNGDHQVGGLTGFNGTGLYDCYSRCTVDGNEWVGGLVGDNHTAAIWTCYSVGAVGDGDRYVGGLVGRTYRGSISSSFWDVETSGQTTSPGIGFSTPEMQTASTFLEAGWDFVGETGNGTQEIWWILEGKDYPRLWWEPRKYGGGMGEPNAPYLIYTAEHLNALGAEPNDYDKHFKLMTDIDLSGYTYDRAVIAPDTNDADWDFQATAFSGVFDGNRYAVLHLTITGRSYLGLFGQLGSGAEVKDLGVVDVNITGSYYAVGGLVGNNFGGRITTSYSAGTVTGYTHVGGLAGYNESGEIAASHSTCAVSVTLSGNQKIGGLVGVNAGRTATSYSTGAVSGQRVVGGLVGWTTGSISMCYSTGVVSADQHVGGLVGDRHPDYGIVTGCFWDVETSGQSSSAGGTGVTTAGMQTAATFLDAGWDLIGETTNGTDDIWWILEGQDYPRLWWEAAELIIDD